MTLVRPAGVPPSQVSPDMNAGARGDAHLRLDGVTKRFGAVDAVDHVTLDIPRGAFATLLGPSGCGKTTTLRMIAGFYEPDEGSILLNERRIDRMPAHQRGTAMVFQDYALFPHMTVHANVAYGLRLARVAPTEREKRVAETLEFVGLGGLGERWPSQLSGGQQQRVALARALVVRPEVLLLDEPLSNLDAHLRERMRWELRALQQTLHMTFVYVTHDQQEALAMSDWIAVMRRGHVEQWGTGWEIYYRPATRFMAEFIGAANLQPAEVVDRNEHALNVTFAGHGLTVPAPTSSVGEQVLLCIRPETLTIDTQPRDPLGVSVHGTVARSAFLGPVMRYWVRVGTDEWIVDQSDPGATRLFDGPVVLSVRPERIHVITESGNR